MVMDTRFGLLEQKFLRGAKMLSQTPVERFLWPKIMDNVKSKLFI